MAIPLIYGQGATPLDPDEAEELIPGHISTQGELNSWEQHNIVAGRRWAFGKNRTVTDLMDERFVRELHKRMFDSTWKWAGTFRKTDKNIGQEWTQISMVLRQLLDNTHWQIEHHITPLHEVAVRFHHALVLIHPFPNGNGRHSRLMADLLQRSLGLPDLTWGADLALAKGDVRTAYLSTLRSADCGDFGPLFRLTGSVSVES